MKSKYVSMDVMYYEDGSLMYGSFYSNNDSVLIHRWYRGEENIDKVEKLLTKMMNFNDVKVERYVNPDNPRIKGWTVTYYKSYPGPN